MGEPQKQQCACENGVHGREDTDRPAHVKKFQRNPARPGMFPNEEQRNQVTTQQEEYVDTKTPRDDVVKACMGDEYDRERDCSNSVERGQLSRISPGPINTEACRTHISFALAAWLRPMQARRNRNQVIRNKPIELSPMLKSKVHTITTMHHRTCAWFLSERTQRKP